MEQSDDIDDKGSAKDDLGAEESLKMDSSQLTELVKILRSATGLKSMDTMRLSMPAFLHAPRSLLENSMCLTQPALFTQIGDAKTPEARMYAVVRFMLSYLQNNLLLKKKPLNPVIGEVLKSEFPSADASEGKVEFVIEQIEHHPPVSLFHYQNEQKGLSMIGEMDPEISFTGTSLKGILNKKPFKITVGDEVYLISMPVWFLRGLLFGKAFPDFNGHMKITCEQTSYSADLHFKPKPWFFGKYRKVEGSLKYKDEELYTFEGYWDNIMLSVDKRTKKEEVCFDATSTAVECPYAPIDQMAKLESKRLWSKFAEALNAKNYKEADREKQAVEALQRKYIQQLEKDGKTHQPEFFKRNENNEWVYNKEGKAKDSWMTE